MSRRRWTYNRMWRALMWLWWARKHTRPCINCGVRLQFKAGDWVTSKPNGSGSRTCEQGRRHRI